MRKILLVALMILTPYQAQAQNTYNSNIFAKINSVITYTEESAIIFTASPMPTVPQCGGYYFVIPSSISTEIRQQLLSRLLLAYSTGEKVNIGYDGQLCSQTHQDYIRVFRVG